MISILIGFKDFFNLVFFAAMAAGIGLWVYHCIKNKSRINLLALCLVSMALVILWSRINGLNHDEAEHLHCSWMVSQGLVPFVGFWQHHSPLLWVMMAPLMKILPQTTLVFDISRLIGTFIFVLIGSIGWSICRKVWGKDAQGPVYLLLLSGSAAIGEYFWLRPDIFNVLFLLAGVRVSLDIPGKRIFTSFVAGISFGLAMAFVPKQLLLCLLPAIVIMRERHRQWLGKVFCFVLGLFLGLTPLVWYLVSFNIVSDFIQWVVLFNPKNLIFSVFLPLANVVAGIWAVKILIGRYRALRDNRAFALIAAVILSTISSLFGLGLLDSGYYLACWFVLIAAAGSSLPLWEIGDKIRSIAVRASVTGIFLSLLILPSIYLMRLNDDGIFSDDKNAISRILEYSRGDQCVVLLPQHPVFVRDATLLYSFWQIRFAEKNKMVRDYSKRKAIAAAIISSRPAVVACRYGKRDFILELYQRKLITSGEYKELIAFLTANYRQEQIGNEMYYIRNDRYIKHIRLELLRAA